MHSLNKVFWPIVFLLLIQLYMPSEMFWLVGFTIVLYEILLKKRGKFIIPFKEYKILFLFIPWGFIIGIIGQFRGDISFLDMVRDIFYYLNPIIFLFLGGKFAKDRVNIYHIFNAFTIASGLVCSISFVNLIINSGSLTAINSINQWRHIVGDGHIVTAISLAVLLAHVVPKEESLPKLVILIATTISVLYFILTLSRTNIMIVAILYIVLLLQKGNTKIVFIRVFGTLLFVVFLIIIANTLLPKDITSAFIDKMLSSFTEINSSHEWNTVAEVQANWRGYETSCAILQWKNTTLPEQIFGQGFGKRIDVGIYAYTLLKQVDKAGTPMTSIAVLHNGYATQLVKLGVVGVIIYILFYFQLIYKAYSHMRIKDTLEARILLALGIIFLIQTYFLNGLFKDVVFLSTIILIGYTAYKVERNFDDIGIKKENPKNV